MNLANRRYVVLTQFGACVSCTRSALTYPPHYVSCKMCKTEFSAKIRHNGDRGIDLYEYVVRSQESRGFIAFLLSFSVWLYIANYWHNSLNMLREL